VAKAMAILVESSGVRRLQSAEMIESLCSEEISVQHCALLSLYAIGDDGRKRFESGAPVAADFERLGPLLGQLSRDSAEVRAGG
jgi:hypothetical protein